MGPRNPPDRKATVTRYHLCLVDSLRTWGGAEVWFLETAAELSARGVGVSLVAQPGSALRARALAAGVAVDGLSIRCDGAPWTLLQLTRILRRRGATALIANLTKDLKAAAAAGRLAGVPVRLGSRESDFPLKDKAYYRWTFTRLATGLLVNSAATGATVRGSAPWLDPARVHLLYKGIDTRRFRPAGGTRAAPVVGFLGQLIRRKGLPELMAAWSLLEREPALEAATLQVAGSGPLAADLARWRAGLARPDRVRLLGQIEDAPAFLQGCRVLAMPSHAEGFGLAAAEAAACGVPVVAADASSLPEIVVHDATGLLTAPGDVPALAAALRDLLLDPDRAARLGRAGRERVLARFDRERTLARLLALTGGPALPPAKGDRR